ncbi:glycosyltransferase family 2 protein [Actinomadura terrae]|uniref:glycosyltransferase family 2 protein n=1 Tax=Actinomadura terrae TaxID=604353 RepID=UPI001FA7AE97|nr:glycosyltransferase [Actinomadura terrae]
MSLISIVTPIYNPAAEHLNAAYESIASQELPEGWEWEWVLQEDGSTGVAMEMLPRDSRIKFGEGRRGGVALTRNLALARSRGELVKNLDHDDFFTPGVLARDIAVLVANNDIQWTTSPVLDLLPDGSTVGFESDPPEGRLERGVVFEHWKAHNYRLPVHPTTICIRRPLVTAIGGWMGVPGSDDTGMLVAASVLSVGYFHGEVGLLYRKWPGQETAGKAHYQEVEWNSRMSLIRERGEAISRMINVL